VRVTSVRLSSINLRTKLIRLDSVTTATSTGQAMQTGTCTRCTILVHPSDDVLINFRKTDETLCDELLLLNSALSKCSPTSLAFRVRSPAVEVAVQCIWELGAAKREGEVKTELAEHEETSRVAHLPYYNDASFTPNWLTPHSEEEQQFHKIPDFRLVNQLGDTITQKTFADKIYITDFFFTSCPGICLKMTGNMLKLQEEFIADEDIALLSHSVTPSIDSVAVLKAYADKQKVVANKWHLATGDKTEIYKLGRHEYFVEHDLGIPKDINDFLHTENFLLIDKNKHIRGIYNGLNRASIAQLITDVKALKKEL